MSWSSETAFGVHVILDEHGGPKEQRHTILWKEMKEELEAAVQAVMARDKYAELNPEIW